MVAIVDIAQNAGAGRLGAAGSGGARKSTREARCCRCIGARRALVTALDGETDKSDCALGFNVGRKMGEREPATATTRRTVLRGMRACVLGEEPDVPLSEYVPKAAAILQAKQAAAAEASVAAGAEALKAAAAEDGATQTASGAARPTARRGLGRRLAANK